MPDPQKKIVKVPDLGIVAFPASMPDEGIAAVIKKFREEEDKLAEVKKAAAKLRPVGVN